MACQPKRTAFYRLVEKFYPQFEAEYPERYQECYGFWRPAIQTFGDLIHSHPHIHALISEGVFLPEGTFLPLPKLATEPFLKLWEQEVFNLLLAEGKIT